MSRPTAPQGLRAPRWEGTRVKGRVEPLIPIIQKAFDFNLALYAYVNRFPRAHKALLGREMLHLALDLVVLLVTANHRGNKVPELKESSAKLDALRITLRLAKQLSFLSNRGYEVLSEALAEIGRMLGGWLKESVARMTHEFVSDPDFLRPQFSFHTWRATV